MKKGFSLVEVVFAIVIISISMMSVPMLLSQSSKSDTFAVVQETILASKSKMGNILSYMWDDNTYDSTNKLLRILDISASGDSELIRVEGGVNNDNLRIGNIFQDKRRRFHEFKTGKVFPSATTNLSNKKSIDDFHGESIASIGASGGKFDYKDTNMTMTSNIYYISDSATYGKDITFNFIPNTTNPITSNTNSTNIKMIELRTTTTNLNQTFVLRSFSSNIGQSTLYSRSY